MEHQTGGIQVCFSNKFIGSVILSAVETHGNQKDSNPQIKAFLLFFFSGGSSCNSSSCGPCPLIVLALGSWHQEPRQRSGPTWLQSSCVLGGSFWSVRIRYGKGKISPSKGETSVAEIQGQLSFWITMLLVLNCWNEKPAAAKGFWTREF